MVDRGPPGGAGWRRVAAGSARTHSAGAKAAACCVGWQQRPRAQRRWRRRRVSRGAPWGAWLVAAQRKPSRAGSPLTAGRHACHRPFPRAAASFADVCPQLLHPRLRRALRARALRAARCSSAARPCAWPRSVPWHVPRPMRAGLLPRRRSSALRRQPRVPPSAPYPLTPPTYLPGPLPPVHPQLPPGSVDVEILHDATRREAKGG